MKKKYLILTILSFFLLSWCSNLKAPKIIISSTTDYILDNVENKTPNEISYTIPDDYKEGWWKLSYISWYKYRYIYNDLWFTIGIADPYTKSFYNIPDNLIFKRYWNRVFDPKHTWFFIEMFLKPNESKLYPIIQTQILSWCVAEIASWNLFHSRSGIDMQNAFEIIWQDNSVGPDSSCQHPDKENPDTPFGIYYVQSKYQQDRYYKISYPSACAPTCQTFTDIEFF